MEAFEGTRYLTCEFDISFYIKLLLIYVKADPEERLVILNKFTTALDFSRLLDQEEDMDVDLVQVQMTKSIISDYSKRFLIYKLFV